MTKTEEQKKFDKFILKMYDIWQEDKGIVCILYTAISHTGFTEIRDINGFVSSCNVDCIYIKSLKTGKDIQIYSWDLEKLIIRVYQEKGLISIKQKKCMKKPVQIRYK